MSKFHDQARPWVTCLPLLSAPGCSAPIPSWHSEGAPIEDILRFELSSQEVIDLLAGNNIYPDPRRVVVRELLQNAVDACRLRRAVTPGYEPMLSFTWQPGRLVVVDNGAGMTEEILRGYFLRVGRSYYSSDTFRDQYGALGFSPIARFGIGALSAFLVARRLVVETRHHGGGEPVRLEIEGLHSIIRKAPAPADTPVGTRLELELREGVSYPDLSEVVAHFARHLEFGIRVRAGERETWIPPGAGSLTAVRLLDPAVCRVRDPARRHQLRSRRVEIREPGVDGFIEYAYLQVPGRLAAPGRAEAAGVAAFDPDRVPRAVSLDGIYVGDVLPGFLTGPGVAYDLNLSSRVLGVQLRLARTEFVHDAAYRRLVARVDSLLVADLLELLSESRLSLLQLGDSLGVLLDVPSLWRHSTATGVEVVWDRLGELPIYPLRYGGQRRLVSWQEVLRYPTIARIPVGEDRVAWPESGAHLADDFWWDRHFRLSRLSRDGVPLYTSLDAHPLMDVLVQRHYRPLRVVVDASQSVSYAVLGRDAPPAPRLGGLEVLPLDGAAPAVLFTYVGGWVLNAHHPLVQQVLEAPADDPGRRAAERVLREAADRLGPLPDSARAEEVLCELREELALAAPAEVPAHDTAGAWSALWQEFLLSGAG